MNAYEIEKRFEHGRRATESWQNEMLSGILVGGEATGFEPALRGAVAGGIYYPNELSGNPLTFVEAAGVVIRTRVDVYRFSATNGRVHRLETSAGSVDAGTFVPAASA